ncbi:ABC transporter family protein [Trichomonas vaginalis G3]|uniref:ABC transporter family protein n=1 Tax=Trichomonas vaginalis (strain ATCC PRA-98 / G3) TaxID=412133 RepID=A2DUV6_TRIV3|nr:ATPase activity, coupled to transmembrane movement of substances [Trichomonas vaginalis G3]EAY15841.1 ABC transporter family protein [Trichomonas vaginalis G3]KAI5524990.1 ATPase activity, coupled to transmembrane movement of substances [Trichomonas vaginalis G3]|eukprot:XP_001328064.1 ABC transporter family protein [Trichomonas vaginalis G3]
MKEPLLFDAQHVDKTSPKESSQWRIYKAYLKILFNVRFRKFGFYISIAASALLIYLSLNFQITQGYKLPKDSNGHYHEFREWGSSQDIYPIEYYLYDKNFDYAFYPRTHLTELLANYTNQSKIFDDESAFEEFSKKPSTFSLRVEEKSKNSYNITSKIYYSKESSYFWRYEIQDFPDSLIKEFIKESSNVTYEYYPLSMTAVQKTDYLIVFIERFVSLAITISLIVPLFEISEARETKQLLLLKISGAYETTIFFANLTIDLLVITFDSISISIVLYKKSYKGSNIIPIFIMVFFLVLYYYSFFLCSVPLSIISKYKIYFSGLFMILSLSPLFNITMNSNNNSILEYASILSLLPQWMSTMFIDNIMVSSVFNIPFTLKNLLVIIRWKDSLYILGIAIGFICAYLFIYFLLNILMPRNCGSPPIGFRNIFNLSAWKELFTFKKERLVHNENLRFIEIRGIDKTYRSSPPVHALNNVSFSLDKDETILLIGPNGSGKSTLLNAITGSISSDRGSLQIYGHQCSTGFSALQQHLGICYQENILFEGLSVYRHLEFFGTIRGIDSFHLQEEIEHIVSHFGLEGLENMSASTLSGGQKRKLCVAIAFIGHPSLVILDEPTSGMDASIRQEIWKSISSYNVTSIVSTHSIEEAGILSNRMFVMRNGSLIFDGTPNDLRSQFHCGYRLTPIFSQESDKQYKTDLVSYIQSKIDGVYLSPIHEDDIMLPVCDEITELLVELESNKERFHINSFNIIVEQLENVLYRMYADDENL